MTDEKDFQQPTDAPAEVVARTPELYGQVGVAKSYPRTPSKVSKSIMQLATMDAETAESCFYVLKRKERRTGETKKIQGPSIRLAEITAHCYTNIRWGGRSEREEHDKVICVGIAHDLETNNYHQVEVARRITTREGRRYSDDMITVTTMAGIAVCKRNALLTVVPSYIWKPAYEAAIDMAVGDASTLADRRQKMVAKFAQMGVGVEKILAFVEKQALEQVGLEDLQDLIGAFNAIREGEQSVDEVFGGKAQEISEPRAKSESEGQPQATEPEPPKEEKPVAQPLPPEQKDKPEPPRPKGAPKATPPKKEPASPPQASEPPPPVVTGTPPVPGGGEAAASHFMVQQVKNTFAAHNLDASVIPDDLREAEAMHLINNSRDKNKLQEIVNNIHKAIAQGQRK